MLFKKSEDYKMIFQSEKHYCFDECNFKHGYLEQGGDIFDINCQIESMHHVIKKEAKSGLLRVYFEFLIIEGLPGQLVWNKGILSFKGEFEVLLYHLILYKSNYLTQKQKWKKIPDLFYIDKYTIRKRKKSLMRGALNHIINGRLRPGLLKFRFRVDQYLSKVFKIRVNYDEQEFSFGTNSLIIMYGDDGENKLRYKGVNKYYSMISSVLFSNSFYIREFPFLRFKLINNELIQYSFNGNTQVYK